MQFLWHAANKNEVGWIPDSEGEKRFVVWFEESNAHNFEDYEAEETQEN